LQPEQEGAEAGYTEALNAAPIDIVCLGIGVNGHIAFNDPPVADFNDIFDVKRVELDAVCRQQQVDDRCFATLGEVPTHLMHGQTLSLEASLVEHGQPIARNDFLRIVTIAAGLTGPEGAGDVLEMPLNETTHAFATSANLQLAPGTYELTVRARSGTFEREQRHRLEIHDQALSFKVQASGKGKLEIDWQAQPDLINPSSISGYVLVEGPDKFRDVREMTVDEQGPASMTFDVRYGGQYEVTAQTLMRDKAGQTLQLRLAPQTVEVKAPPPPPAGPSLEVPLASAPSPAINAWRTLAIVLGGNVALALVLVPVWYKLRRRAIPSKGVSL
jgi:hypothetical protein